MSIARPNAFPLLPIVQTSEGPRCACGDDACARIGKHPAIPWGELVYGEPRPPPEPGAGAGIKTGARPLGSDIFVVDLDGEAAQSWWLTRDTEEVETYTVETGREGGLQLYFQHPGFKVSNSVGLLAKGIDIRGDGGFVVAPGSPHRSGRTYRVAHDIPPAPAPAWLLEWLRARSAPATEIQTYPGDIVDGEERAHRLALYRKYCREARPSVQGERDVRLFDIVQHGAYDLQLPTADVLAVVAEDFNPRCQPPMEAAELERAIVHKAHDAKTRSTRQRAEPIPADLGHLVLEMPPPPPPPPPKPKRAGVDLDAQGMFWDAWDVPLEPPKFLVEGLVPVGTVGMLVAMGSSLKTWTLLSIAGAVAQGKPWLDRYVTRGGRVLIADYESGMYELQRRIRLLEGGRVAGLGAWPFPQVRIDDPAFWEAAEKVEGLALLGIDSLAAGAPGGDENDARAATPLHMAGRFAEATGAAVVLIHHSKKDDGGDDRKAVRGSTALYNACDWAYKFEVAEETATDRRMYMVSIKPCMGPKPPPVPISLSDSGLVYFEPSGGVAPPDASDNEVQAAIKLALARGPIATKEKLAAAVRMQKDRVRVEVDALMVREEIDFVPGYGYVLKADAEPLWRARIVAVVAESPYWTSEAAIAKKAGCPTSRVTDLVRDGVVLRSAEGRFLVRPDWK